LEAGISDRTAIIYTEITVLLFCQDINDMRYEMKGRVRNPGVSDSGAGSRWLIEESTGTPGMGLNWGAGRACRAGNINSPPSLFSHAAFAEGLSNATFQATFLSSSYRLYNNQHRKGAGTKSMAVVRVFMVLLVYPSVFRWYKTLIAFGSLVAADGYNVIICFCIVTPLGQRRFRLAECSRITLGSSYGLSNLQ
jgi:hypothetical protein